MAAQPWIAELESALGATLPSELRTLYEKGDGEKDLWPDKRPMRLLPSAEALADYRELSRSADLRGSCPFWVSDNGDRAIVFLSGPLRGRVGLWDSASGYPSEPVAYRSAASFVASLNEAAREGLDWYEMPTDYLVSTSYYSHGAGVCKPATAEEIESDREAFRAMMEAHESGEFGEGDELFYAVNAIALAPPDGTGSLVRFLDSEDMYVQEPACTALGHRRYEPAIPRLAALAREPGGNGQTAAVTALGKIGTSAARDAILASVPGFSEGLDLLLAQALEATGCETRFDEDKFRRRTYQYRLPDAAEWNALR
jgi:hypothetical protein